MLGLRMELILRLLLMLQVTRVAPISTGPRGLTPAAAAAQTNKTKPPLYTTTKKPNRLLQELPERCRYLKDQKELWHLRCRGRFPLVAYTKFRDTFMKQDDRMALFMPDSLDHVMVSLKESELHGCESIQFVAVNEYICFDPEGGKRTLTFARAKMYCFPFHIQLTDDLMHECIKERDDVTNSPLETKVLQTKRGIIHYIFDNDSGVESLNNQRNLKLIQMLIMIMVIIMAA